jgi:hypothetical protein
LSKDHGPKVFFNFSILGRGKCYYKTIDSEFQGEDKVKDKHHVVTTSSTSDDRMERITVDRSILRIKVVIIMMMLSPAPMEMKRGMT